MLAAGKPKSCSLQKSCLLGWGGGLTDLFFLPLFLELRFTFPMTSPRDDNHLHGPSCGHLSIAHCDAKGSIHIGFLDDHGDLTCFAPSVPASSEDLHLPKGSLFNVCLRSDGFGLHRRTTHCQNNNTACWTKSRQFEFHPVDQVTKCQIRNTSCLGSSTNEPHHHHHDHLGSDKDHHNSTRPVQSKPVIKHDGHLDFFLGNSDGTLDLHCSKDEGNPACHVHASLKRIHNEVTPSTWLDLFVFANQTSTSILQITKGLCCKKEVPKIQQLIDPIAKEHDLKFEVDPKTKSVTIWHGSETSSWLPVVVNLLSCDPFRCEITSLNGEAVASCIVSSSNDDDVVSLPATPPTTEGVVFTTPLIQHDKPSSSLMVVHFFEASKTQVLNDFIVARRGSHLKEFLRQPVHMEIFKVIKGLCCKKETPKVEAALMHVSDLLCVRVEPKEKQVVLFFPSTAAPAAISMARDALIEAGFSVKEEEKEEEERLPHQTLGAPEVDAPLPPPSLIVGQCRSILSVQGVCCAAEVPSVRSVCIGITGVTDVTVSIFNKQVHVTHDITSKDLAEALAKRLTDNGFPSQVLLDGCGTETKIKSIKQQSFFISKWYVILATLLWLISWLSLIGEDWDGLKYCAVVSVALGWPRIAYKALLSLRRCILDINMLMSVAVVGALAIQDFHEAATVVSLFCLCISNS